MENNDLKNTFHYKEVLVSVFGTTVLLLAIFLPIIFVVLDEKTVENNENYDIQGAYNLDKEYEKYGQRNAGTEEAIESRIWIENYLVYWGYQYEEFYFKFPVSSSDYRYIPGEDVEATGTDIIFEKAGSSEETILISAHYDSSPGLYGSDGTAFSDNGSGTAIVLELAQLLSVVDSESLPYTVRFGLWDAEEHGEYGGEAYASWLSEQENKDDVILDINLDTPVGGNYTYLEAPGQGVALAGNAQGNDLKNETGFAISAGVRNAVQDAAYDAGYQTFTTPSYSHRDNDLINPFAAENDPNYSLTSGDESLNYHLYGNGFNYTTAYTGTESGYPGEGYPASDWEAFMENGIPSMGIESTNYRIDYSWNVIGDGYPQLYEEEAWKLMTKEDFVSYWSDTYYFYQENNYKIPQNRLYQDDEQYTPYSGYGFTEKGKEIDFGKQTPSKRYVIDEENLETNLSNYYDAEYEGFLDKSLQIDNVTGQPFPYEMALQNNSYRPGSTWHTQLDNSEWYEKNVGIENLTAQFTMVVDTLMQFILNADDYLDNYYSANGVLAGNAANTGSDFNPSWDYVNE